MAGINSNFASRLTKGDDVSRAVELEPTDKPEKNRPHRWRWILPALLTLAWLALGAFGGPYAGKLSEVVTNDASSFLPATAEATEVNDLREKFDDSGAIPAIVVAERESGLTADDQEYLAESAKTLGGLDFVAETSPPLPDDRQDPRAVQIIVGVDEDADTGDAVTEIRAELGTDRPEDLTVLVTGPAAQAADLGEAFSGIDGMLLLVTGAAVALILVLVYRSPLLPLLVLASCGFALGAASLSIHALAQRGLLDLNGQSQGILFILVFGAATDYALLLVSRFREELRTTEDRYRAIMRAWKATLAPIAASAGTVILGVSCLLVSDLNSNRTLGPVAAIGIAAALLASVTFLPAVLALTGRAAFWPRRTKVSTEPARASRLWRGIAGLVGARPRLVWVLTAFVLLIGVAFVPQLRAEGTAQSEVFLKPVDSVAGQELLSDHFPAGSGSPTIIIAESGTAETVAAEAKVDGVESAEIAVDDTGRPKTADGLTEITVTLSDAADSAAAVDTVRDIREAVHDIPGAGAKVGGPTAIQLDTQDTSERDRSVIIPLVLAVILAVLIPLLRSIVAPLLLIGTVVLSFAATMGVSALVFNHLLGFPGADPVVPLFGFVFLVALGVDYNIFLMTRVREETAVHGVRSGTLKALTITGGVITSAGVVLAATFSALAVLPILFLAQIAFIVAFGVLLDTLLVRSLLVPALTLDLGRRTWWPSRLSRGTAD